MNHDYFNNIPLSEAVARMVDDSGRPLKAIAAEIGKGYSTLYRELDPADDGAKIGVDSLLPLIRACHLNDFPPKVPPAPVLWISSKCGFRPVPFLAEPDHDDVRDEQLDDFRTLAAFQDAIREGQSPDLVAAKANEAHREIDQTLEQYRREYEKARAGGGK